jgi:hypothetical protein
MTRHQYLTRLRLLPLAGPVPPAWRLTIGDMFEIMTLRGEIAFAKITAQWGESLFDLTECDASGRTLPGGLVVGSVKYYEIKERLLERDWRYIPQTKHGR